MSVRILGIEISFSGVFIDGPALAAKKKMGVISNPAVDLLNFVAKKTMVQYIPL